MSYEIFIDGICELDDKIIRNYFSRFGSRISTFDSHRHRPTNSCCFALISFNSLHTVNAILRHRPHSINLYPLFVKRLLPAGLCSFIERLLPVSSLFVFNTNNQEFNEYLLKKYFKTYGNIIKFEHDYGRDRLLIEYDDYDSVDLVFLNKNTLPNNIEIHKNISPRAQTNIEYHGTCRQNQQQHDELSMDDEIKKKQRRHEHRKTSEYQDLLQRTIENLSSSKAQLKAKENAYAILQIEYATLKDQNEKFKKILYEQKIQLNDHVCLSCKEYERFAIEQKRTLIQLKEQYDAIKCQYQRLLLIRCTPTIPFNSVNNDNKSFSQRDISATLTPRQSIYDETIKPESSTRSQLPTPGFCDIAIKQRISSCSMTPIRMQHQRIPYKYNSVTCDEK